MYSNNSSNHWIENNIADYEQNNLSKDFNFYEIRDRTDFQKDQKQENDDIDQKRNENENEFTVRKMSIEQNSIHLDTNNINHHNDHNYLAHSVSLSKNGENENDKIPNHLSNDLNHYMNENSSANQTYHVNHTGIKKSTKLYQKVQPSIPKPLSLLRSSSFSGIGNNQQLLLHGDSSSVVIEKMRQNILETNRAAAQFRRECKKSISDNSLSSLESDSSSSSDENEYEQMEIEYPTKRVNFLYLIQLFTTFFSLIKIFYLTEAKFLDVILSFNILVL